MNTTTNGKTYHRWQFFASHHMVTLSGRAILFTFYQPWFPELLKGHVRKFCSTRNYIRLDQNEPYWQANTRLTLDGYRGIVSQTDWSYERIGCLWTIRDGNTMLRTVQKENLRKNLRNFPLGGRTSKLPWLLKAPKRAWQGKFMDWIKAHTIHSKRVGMLFLVVSLNKLHTLHKSCKSVLELFHRLVLLLESAIHSIRAPQQHILTMYTQTLTAFSKQHVTKTTSHSCKRTSRTRSDCSLNPGHIS